MRKHSRRRGKVEVKRGNRKLTAVLVVAILELHHEHGLGYDRICGWLLDWHNLSLSKRTVRGILNYERWIAVTLSAVELEKRRPKFAGGPDLWPGAPGPLQGRRGA